MSLGTEQLPKIVSLGDTVPLVAYAYTDRDATVDPDEVIEVNYTVRLPDGTTADLSGEIQPDGSAFARYDTSSGSQIGEYH